MTITYIMTLNLFKSQLKKPGQNGKYFINDLDLDCDLTSFIGHLRKNWSQVLKTVNIKYFFIPVTLNLIW